MPDISVIIPVYNTEDYLARCLDSLINQNYKNVEIIVVNDGSFGNCDEIIENYRKKTEIKYIKNEVNRGTFYARDMAIRQASGKYILCVDSDDYLENDSLSKISNIILENDYDIVIFNYIEEYKNGIRNEAYWQNRIFVEKTVTDRDELFYELFYGHISNSLPSKMFKKSLYESVDFEIENVFFLEDYLIIVRLLYYSKSVKIIPDEYYVYFQRSDSATKFSNMSFENKKKTLRDLKYVFDSVKTFFIEKNIYESYKEAFIYRENDYYNWIYSNIIKNLDEKERVEINLLCYDAFESKRYYFDILNDINDAFYTKNEVAISVIIPVFNTEKYLYRCLDSIFDQSFKNIEIIVVDDCSLGNCKEIVSKYRKENISYLRNSRNMGSAWSRVHGLSKASGKYIHFVDSDDWVVKDCYANIYKYLNNKYEVLHFHGVFADDKKNWKDNFQVSYNNELYGNRAAFDDMFFGDSRKRTLWCRVFDRKCALKGALNMPKEHLSVADDWLLNLFILFYVKKYKSVSDELYYYYQDNPFAMTAVAENKSKTSTKKVNNCARQTYIVYNALVKFLIENEVWHLYKSVWALYISRDLKYMFTNMFIRFEDYILDLYKTDKDKYIKESIELFRGYAKPSNILTFIRDNLYESNNFSEEKLWQVSRTTWFYKIISRLLRPRNIFNAIFHIGKNSERIYVNIFFFKFTIKRKSR